MDPLSVSASIVGILGAATKVSSILHSFVQNAKGAPKLAQTVLTEVNGLSTVLGHLQTYILGLTTSSRSRTSLILVEQVIVTLADCVTTFSELEAVLGTARIESELRILDRMKWAAKESKVADIQGRLQSNKSSLTLMLTILSCKSNEEAESATSRLCDLVEQVLADNREMSLRLRNIDNAITGQAQTEEAERDGDASNTSSGTMTPPHGHQKDVPEGLQRKHLSFAFEEDLFASRVYRKPLFGNSGDSLFTAAARTTAWSILSGISLTDVSNISVLAVPIYAYEISNSARYIFGDFRPESLTVDDQEAASNAVQQISKVEQEGGFDHVYFRNQGKAAKPDTLQQPEPKVLGVPLQQSIQNNKIFMKISYWDGEHSAFGYIPLVVYKAGGLLKGKATEVENIFSISGSARRLQVAEDIFHSPPEYGRYFDWTGYTAHDAACILLRFMFRLPKPVIPVDRYEAFHAIFVQQTDPEFDHATASHKYRRLLTSLLPLSRHLLLYLLDLLAVFASKSEFNKMTSQRLAAIFQPAILSLVRPGEDFIEEAGSCRLSQMVLVFLIENWDGFKFGIAEVPYLGGGWRNLS